MKIKKKQCCVYSMYYQHSFDDGCIWKFFTDFNLNSRKKKKGKAVKKFLGPNDDDLSLLLVLFLLLSNWINSAK